ncbi:hypothetical protein CGLO_14090 [Colletotrichum gloeosporioides Cg-14]|uniref:Uncharacterized protein n=1 Tax=Colletotrichum gloeosporioides (strain Cg-14) TaxID=1237896 RepID=T0L5J0_COLGC|nr:hypothetical protein CGLO_14090 [Colletotrichum gloeosporioides Cg-14]
MGASDIVMLKGLPSAVLLRF